MQPYLSLKIMLFSVLPSLLMAQQSIPLQDLSAFKPTQPNWSIANSVTADLAQNNKFVTEIGKGVLVCQLETVKYEIEYDLFSKFEHGDIDLELDFMMAKGANSGIYFQSRYELQLLDSWGKAAPQFSDCGGIYQRWDDTRPDALKGYEGYAPRFNVAKAPGLWQHLKVSFQAPRFDASGKKITNAKFLAVVLNGVVIHENLELTGPTRGALENNEVSLANLRIQGNHGSVAFKNIQYKTYNQQKLTFTELKYGVYKGKFVVTDDIEKIQPETSGNADLLNWAVSNEENLFAVKYVGKINVPEAGTYKFTTVHGGNTQMKINGQEAFKNGWLFTTSEGRHITIDLPKGEAAFELYYWKQDGWMQPILGLYAESSTIRRHALHVPTSTIVGEPIPMIYAKVASEPVILRSFMDIPNGENKSMRIVHAVSVGNKQNLHYTYNMDNGALFQVWKGDFLNTTPMWHDRGDGSSKPLGSLYYLNNSISVDKLANADATWNNDPNAGVRPRGYELDTEGIPTFLYEVGGARITDKITPLEHKYFQRDLKTTVNGFTHRVAVHKLIKKISPNLFLIGDSEYYIKVLEGEPTLRKSGDMQELLMPLNAKISYQILW